MRRLVLLRPEPGLSESAARACALGLEVVTHPLFTVQPVDWAVPNEAFEALALTSANSVRHAGPQLDDLRHLATYTVGEATAKVAREAGLNVVSVGSGSVEGMRFPAGRYLHLCGERHRALPGDGVSVPVYRTVPTANPLPPMGDAVVAVHSPAAGERLALLISDREFTRIAAISPAAARACGEGWGRVESAAMPDDSSLLALAAALCQSDDV